MDVVLISGAKDDKYYRLPTPNEKKITGIIEVLIGVNKPTRFQSTGSGSFRFCYNLVLTSMSLSGIMSGSLKIAFRVG